MTNTAHNVGLTFQNASRSSRSTLSPIETPPEDKRSQNANTSHLTPFPDEAKLWQGKEQLLESVPEQDRTAVKLGILEEYILYGIRAGRDTKTLFLLAALGISLANNDRPFFDEVKRSLS